MNSSSDKDKNSSSFMAAFKEGYEEEDAKARKDTAPIERKIVEGVVTGVTETIVHPFRWIRSLLK
jgi:hypothetical protein